MLPNKLPFVSSTQKVNIAKNGILDGIPGTIVRSGEAGRKRSGVPLDAGRRRRRTGRTVAPAAQNGLTHRRRRNRRSITASTRIYLHIYICTNIGTVRMKTQKPHSWRFSSRRGVALHVHTCMPELPSTNPLHKTYIHVCFSLRHK